jgi:hypothetical protein
MEVIGPEMLSSVVNEQCQLQKISAIQKQQIIEPFLRRLLVVAIEVLLRTHHENAVRSRGSRFTSK